MATKKFKKQLESLNDAALFFGSTGYHVELSIHGSIQTANLTIFYRNESETKNLNLKLCMFQDEGDVIEHHMYPPVTTYGKPFYTLKLIKEKL